MSDSPEKAGGDAKSGDPFSHLRHELRTPLNQIIGYSEMLQEDAEAAGQQAFIPDLQKIHRAAQTLLGTINTHLAKPPSQTGDADVLPTQPIALGERKTFLGALPEKLEGETVFITKIRKAKEDRPSIKITGRILVVDDTESNRDVLGKRLEKQGFTFAMAENGREALARLRQEPFDLVLLDIMMPEVDGFTVLQIMKADARIQHIPVIMISALDEMEAVVRCIEAGADDYLPKPFNPTLLQARIGACLEKKQLRDQEQRTYQALVESQKRLAAELSEAADYVTSLLPAPLAGEIKTAWRFIPSTQLGGDTFGYHWLDADHLAIYLLDVCGHGVGAALLSISVMNVLRSQSLNTDFKNPGAVLSALNEAFQMENQHDMYFTIWYGVFQKSSRQMIYASGGHPPAVLVVNEQTMMLRTKGVAIGTLPGMRFPMGQCSVPVNSVLYVFSDGAYEITKRDNGMMQLDEFVNQLAHTSDLEGLVSFVKSVNSKDAFDDDFSIVQIHL